MPYILVSTVLSSYRSRRNRWPRELFAISPWSSVRIHIQVLCHYGRAPSIFRDWVIYCCPRLTLQALTLPVLYARLGKGRIFMGMPHNTKSSVRWQSNTKRFCSAETFLASNTISPFSCGLCDRTWRLDSREKNTTTFCTQPKTRYHSGPTDYSGRCVRVSRFEFDFWRRTKTTEQVLGGVLGGDRLENNSHRRFSWLVFLVAWFPW